MEPTIEVLEPQRQQPPPSKWRKYGPAIFWGTIVALPAMNMTASIFDYRTAKLNLEIETLKAATQHLSQ